MCVNASVCNSFCAKASVCKRFCVWKTIRRIGCKLVFCTCNILSWYYLSRLPKIHLYYIVLQYSVSILTTDDPALSLSPSFCLSPSLSLSPFLSIYVSLWLQDTCHMMPFTKQHSAYAWVVTCILFLINLTFHNLPLHSSYKIHQPFTDYFLRLPYSELLEKRLFRSRANRRLVIIIHEVSVFIPISGQTLEQTEVWMETSWVGAHHMRRWQGTWHHGGGGSP